MKTLLLIVMVILVVVAASPKVGKKVDTTEIKFTISGGNLTNAGGFLGGSPDGYVKVFVSENFGRKKELGKTNTVSSSKNPEWSTMFKFDFVRSKNQQLHFDVYDHDTFSDDKIGSASINAADFVDNNQVLKVPLNKQGYLQLQGVDVHG